MSKKERVALEVKMCKAFERLIAMPTYGGSYHSLTPGHANKVS